jgi:hypothetical protein
MSWLFSQALVEEYSEGISSDGEPSVQSSGIHTQLAYLQPDKMTDFSRLSRFGMTFKPLKVGRGEALLMSYLEDFHAKTSALQEKEQDCQAKDQECGITWHGWLAKFDRITSTLKTAQCSLFEEELESLKILPRSGMTVNGMLWERQTLVRHTNETEFGYWPTPTVCGNYNKPGISATSGMGLASAVKLWPTPQASDNRPRATAKSTARRIKIGKQVSLEAAVKFWPTPTSHNAKEGGFPSEHNRNTPTLSAQAGGSLNPVWVEWLMGWPLGWTDLKPLETDKFQQWQQQHGDC